METFAFVLGAAAVVAVLAGTGMTIVFFRRLGQISRRLDDVERDAPQGARDVALPDEKPVRDLTDQEVANRVIQAAVNFDLWARVTRLRKMNLDLRLEHRENDPPFADGRAILSVRVTTKDGTVRGWPT